ncbi:hypothetical protein TH19_12680 [Thalassospira profundimaris]|uniref:Uncharacterized protein n=1 Tax=Thalassospira profundimaris TaxID=502049 RepID=A0A367W5P8_9PROT|nr:hypothetical protein TH19_12680 [Thalassospira profundimaris]
MATLAAIIHVKLTGEGDFGPVDLECAIPPARLPVVMAALFGQPVSAMGAMGPLGAVPGQGANHSMMRSASRSGFAGQGDGGVSAGRFSDGGNGGDVGTRASSNDTDSSDAYGAGATRHASVSSPAQDSPLGRSHDSAMGSAPGIGQGGMPDGISDIGYFLTPLNGIETGAFITGFMGALGDLIARMQPRGFAETILIAAIWLHYRDGRGFVTRDDIRRILRRQEHLRMPRNFSRDFQVALTRGYLDPVESEDGYAVSRIGYQWFQSECLK